MTFPDRRRRAVSRLLFRLDMHRRPQAAALAARLLADRRECHEAHPL
ncbi:unnamed protein product [[Actinomadura] parvosata subsp. kistnae]|nr:unnamed protein product [Actinomadura parvosata subsp. kistnae]